MQKKTIVSAVAVLSVGVFLTVSARATHVEISGRVYEQTGSSNRAPVAGATVSNDWDSATTTTNARGEFYMRVRRVAGDEWIKFTARVGDVSAFHRRVGSLESIPVEIGLPVK
jgi:hypothetical protein